MKFVRQITIFEITLVSVEIFKVEEKALVMNEEGPGVPRRNVKLDHTISWNSKCCNPADLRSRAVCKVIGRSNADKPVFTLHRPQTLADAPMARHLGEGKPVFLEIHDPQARRAIRKNQLRLFDAIFRIVRVVVELAARRAGKNNFAVWSKCLRLKNFRRELGHRKCGHKRCTTFGNWFEGWNING
ncbi:MAG TPA: hypothetical protein VIV34_07400 [Pseudolabrys sp.]